MHVRNAHKDVGYFCDVDGAATITRALLFAGANGLDTLRCPVKGLSRESLLLGLPSLSARLITNEGFQPFSFLFFASRSLELEPATSVEDAYATLTSFSVDLGRREPVERESAAVVLFEAGSRDAESLIYLNFEPDALAEAILAGALCSFIGGAASPSRPEW
jgi:hypothetical protein